MDHSPATERQPANVLPEDGFDIESALQQYGDSLLRLCYLYLKDYALAEDALQDAFLNAYRNYAKFRGDCSEKTWITRIAINVCKSYLRKSWFKKVDQTATLPDCPVASPSESLDENSLLIQAIKELPPKFREVILLYYYQEFKITEISKVLHIPVGTVSTRLSRARDRLKKTLKGWDYDEANER